MDSRAYEQQLISEVEAHSILYDKSIPGHKSQSNIDNAWLEIAKVLNLDEQIIRKKWKNLRDTFRAKHKEYSLAGDKKKKEWIFYRKMFFLLPFMEISRTEPGNTTTGSNSTTSSNTSDSEDTREKASEAGGETESEESPECETAKFAIPLKRKADDRTRGRIGNKIIKVLDNVDNATAPPEANANPPQSSIRQFLNSLATKCEQNLNEYEQNVLEMSIQQVYQNIRFPQLIIEQSTAQDQNVYQSIRLPQLMIEESTEQDNEQNAE